MRAFEAAARLESFSQAASELGVTQSAISKQVAALEQHIGRTLFSRFHRRVELTQDGVIAARVATASFATLSSGLADMRERRPEQIELVADADFTHCWLFPRLPQFERRNPDVRITLRAETSLLAAPDDCDCAILWGRGEWTGQRFEPLFANSVFPVATPSFFGNLGRKPRLSDLRNQLLIHDRNTKWWATILASEGITEIDPHLGRTYNQTSLCLMAAARGDGVTVGDEVTARSYLESGQLVIPFSIRIPSPEAYYLVRPLGAPESRTYHLFREWLLEEIREHVQWFARFWDV
ncbi:DNA-binding transcriptional LysR family regulator [Mesorhizobium shonense]|uniref:DNA-binding transcriptional LysR family regulator n=1 Tax=Mesorhizobium shonense TaxID=1209948 RepID=A0ABV2HWR4_9HYPH